MAKTKKFASSIETSLEGRSLSLDTNENINTNNEYDSKNLKEIRNDINSTSERNERDSKNLNNSNTISDINITNTANEYSEHDSKNLSGVNFDTINESVNTSQVTESHLLRSIGFNISAEDAEFIRQEAIKSRMTKEQYFTQLFTETLDYDVDINDSLYKKFTERFKKDVRYTTRIDAELYQKMQDKAIECCLKINGYINYMICRYRLEKRNV